MKNKDKVISIIFNKIEAVKYKYRTEMPNIKSLAKEIFLEVKEEGEFRGVTENKATTMIERIIVMELSLD